jgi:hypothetical protein
MSGNCYYCGGHPDEVADLRRRRDELETEVERLRVAIETVASTFEKDREQGFKTRDKDFAITILRQVMPKRS